jgi:hypothetical protein
MRFSAPLYLFDQKDSSLKVVPLPSVPLLQRGKAEVQPPWGLTVLLAPLRRSPNKPPALPGVI